MSEDKCKKTNCPERIPAEDSGFGEGKSVQTTCRCRVSGRIIRRMKECPKDAK